MYVKTGLWLASCTLSMTLLAGCAAPQNDEANAFREALPESAAIALSGPETQPASGTAALTPTRRTLGTTPALPYAKWYSFTRQMRDDVNGVTLHVLGGVWLMVHGTPSTISNDSAIWGPYTDELSPVSYRLRVVRVAADEYDYRFEGHPKASRADNDFEAVLSGHGFGTAHPNHGQGSFTIDLDVAKELDPAAHANDSGKLTITHTLPREISQNPFALPRTIRAEVEPAGEAHFSLETEARLDHTGALHVVAHTDVDDSKQTLLEDVVIDSRWTQSGAGRADVQMAGGDLPPSVPMVDASECWGPDFTQTYYHDSVNFAPTSGEASACVFGGP